ncbi:hypothetical protein TRFO_38723 [Tritrichomonas foetus]|uniref:Uncharacterized protein n=1 Tax=Tritrichomonas foetus TaxID=1144522 RepID=A0A1J4JA28_9EUKA|nr:hypothetical protein TRFO_38723 [Tritrichomonas foetus]|eukprot:OHS95079.1 hypothetical protein TRFO_38723 [Tritrichomonas foetus]
MASSKILSTVRNAPTLVDGLLVADSLKDILSGLCDLANQQQEEIKILKEQLKNFIPKSEVISMIEDQKMKLNESKAFYSREISSISAKMNQFQNQFLPIASSMKKTKEEVEMKFKEFDNNIENHTQLLFEQYQMTAKSSKRQLDDMKDMLENVTSAHSETRHKLDQLEVLDSQATNARLDEIELKLNKFENNFSDFSEKVTRNETMFKDNNKSTTRILEKLTQDVAECLIVQRAFHESTKGEIEIKDAESLIAAVERNSRRLDGVDMNLSHIKLDQQNVTDIVKSYETVLVTFKHHIYDMTLKQQQTADKVSQKLAKICDFVSFVGRNLDNLYGFCVQGTEKSFLLSETTAKSFDDVRRVLQMISKTTTIPDFNNFTISTEDLENLRSKISSVHADNDPNDYAARFLSLFYLENQNKKRNYHVNFEIDNTKCQKDDEITQDVDLTNGPNETENSHTLKKEKSFTEIFQ